MNRRETQRTYYPGTLFIPRSTGLPGSFCTCMIIGWSNIFERGRDKNGKIIDVKSWVATYIYPSSNIARISQMSWKQLTNYCHPVDDFAIIDNA